MTNLQVTKENGKYRIVYYRGFYKVQEQLNSGAWLDRGRYRRPGDASRALDIWAAPRKH